MPNDFQGKLNGAGLRIGIVVARFNQAITARLLSGALERLSQLGVSDGDVDVVWVPGAFEIPQALVSMDRARTYDGLMTLGCVIRGDTPHFDHVANAASSGVSRFGQSSQTPVVFGVLTCDTVEQALVRSGVKANKGVEVADGLIELINVLKSLKQSP